MESFDSVKTGARMGRRQQMGLQIISAAEALQLENTVRNKDYFSMLRPYVSVIMWLSWMIFGCTFYSCYCDYDVSRGLYISVNIGWGMNWTLDESFQSKVFNNSWFTFVSVLHTAIGTVFLGYSTIYISQALMGKEDKWFQQTSASDVRSYMNPAELVTKWTPQYRVCGMFILWLLLGISMFWATQSSWGIIQALDFVVSSLTGSGYKAIPKESETWQFALAALYCTIGVPLMAVAVGLGVSSLFEPSHDDLLARLIADVTDEEIEFMLEFGIIDDNGKVDKSEFLVLMAVRIGKASIQLLGTIHERFRELDRKNLKKISLDDIVEGRQKITPAMRKAMFANVGLNSVTMSSFADVELELSTLSQRAKLRSSMMSSLSAASSLGTIEDMDDGDMMVEVHAGDKEQSPNSPLTELQNESDESNPEPCIVGECEANITLMQTNITTENVKIGEDQIVDQPNRDDLEYQSSDSENIDPTESPVRLGCSAVSTPLLSKRGLGKLSIDVDVEEDRQDYKAVNEDLKLELVDPLQKQDVAGPKSLQSVIANLRGSAIARHSSMRSPSQFWYSGGEDDEELGSMPPTMASLRQSRFSNWSYASDTNINTPQPPSRGSLRMTPRLGRQGSMQSVSSLPPISPGLQRIISVQSLGISNSYPVFIWGFYLGDLESKRVIWLCKFITHPYSGLLTAWLLWTASGILFYTLLDASLVGRHHSWGRGLYVSSSIGVGMFWMVNNNVIANSAGVKLFTVSHMLLGSVLTGCIRAAVAHSIAKAKGQWYVHALKKKEFMEIAARADVRHYVKVMVGFYGPRVIIHVALMVFIICGVVLAVADFDYPFLDSLYFSVSTLAGGGLKGIPEDAESWQYAVVGIFILFGVPVTAVSLSILVQYLSNIMSRHENLDNVLHMPISEKELTTLVDSGIENADGFIDMSEYTVLILLRIGAISPDLITVVNEWFDDVDSDDCDEVSLEQIKKVHLSPNTPMRRRINSLA